MTRFALIVAVTLSATPSSAQDLPKMKSGLWESTTTSGGPKGVPPQIAKTNMCITESVQKDIMAFSQNMGTQCSNYVMRRDGNKYYGEAECNMGNTTIKSTSVTTFIDDSSFRTENRATFTPAVAGMTESASTQESRFVGSCPATMKPGDVNMGGRTVNINDMGKMLKGAKK